MGTDPAFEAAMGQRLCQELQWGYGLLQEMTGSDDPVILTAAKDLSANA